MPDPAQTYADLAGEIAIASTASGELKVTEFFNIYSQLAAENADSPDLDYSPALSESGLGYRIDGFALDIPEGEEDRSGDLHLAVCLFRQDPELPVINARDVDSAVAQATRFLRAALSGSAVELMEESSHDYRVAMQIRHVLPRLARIRLLIFTNAQLRTKRKAFESRAFGDLAVHINVFDIERYARISSSGADPVEIDFAEDFGGAIQCLPASMGDTGFSSYLFAIHAPVLAQVFATYGNRLLEQNVRTYLQAKTSVNRGILKTIAEEPSMFFAYNNGLTGTASSVQTDRLPDGSLAIARIKDLQIVNGGQTTASILYARDGQKSDLANVHIQVKLSVVGEEKLGEVVPKISAYANTQNKVSLADLASNSPMQVQIQRLSREVPAPQLEGALYATKWFYERARGQFTNLFSYQSAAQRKRLEAEYPKKQLITKTELAKYELAFESRPHHVSEGEQKCFQRFIASAAQGYGDGLAINEFWFKCAVAKAIIFRSLDTEVARSAWYRDAKGLKAQTVAYTLAAAAHAFRLAGMQLDLMRVWRDQSVPSRLLDWMMELAERIHPILSNPPGAVRNPSEFCKKEFCWTLHVQPKMDGLRPDVREFGVPLEEFAADAASGRKESKKNRELDFDIALVNLIPRIGSIRDLARGKQMLSDNSSRALDKLAAGRLNLQKAEKNALKQLLDRLEISY